MERVSDQNVDSRRNNRHKLISDDSVVKVSEASSPSHTSSSATTSIIGSATTSACSSPAKTLQTIPEEASKESDMKGRLKWMDMSGAFLYRN